MIMQRIRQFLIDFVLKERSSSKLAISFCIGAYIAFCPLIGLHTVATLLLCWFLGLNMAVTFATSCVIHNPWTTIPIYGTDYIFGQWLLHDICGFDTMAMNPSWMIFINERLSYYVGLPDIAFWSFMIGGNILALGISIGIYPLVKRLFVKLVDQVHGVAGVQG